MGEIIWTVVATAAAFVGAVVGNMMSDEAADYCERVTRTLLRAAIRQLPTHAQKRYAEEWTADLEERTGKITRLTVAIGLYFGALKLADTLPPTASLEQRKRLVDVASYAIALTNRVFECLDKSSEAHEFDPNDQAAMIKVLQGLIDRADVLDEHTCGEVIAGLEMRFEELDARLADVAKQNGRE